MYKYLQYELFVVPLECLKHSICFRTQKQKVKSGYSMKMCNQYMKNPKFCQLLHKHTYLSIFSNKCD